MLRNLLLLLFFSLISCDIAPKYELVKVGDATDDYVVRYYRRPPNYNHLLAQKIFEATGDGNILPPEGENVTWCPSTKSLLINAGFKSKESYFFMSHPDGYLLLRADEIGHENLLKLHRQLNISINNIPTPENHPILINSDVINNQDADLDPFKRTPTVEQ